MPVSGSAAGYRVMIRSCIIQPMHDMTSARPDHQCLFRVASAQHGHFTSAQAASCGFSKDLLSRHARTTRYRRVRRGLYRLRDFPSSPWDDIAAAWLAVGKDDALVSHESALSLLGLSNVIPTAIHLTVPREKRYITPLPGVTLHTTTIPWGPLDVIEREGIRLTAATRSILDAAESGTAPEQIDLAVRQAIARGLATPGLLERSATVRNRRVRDIVATILAGLRP